MSKGSMDLFQYKSVYEFFRKIRFQTEEKGFQHSS